jgi:hypothetical protein
MEIVVSRLTLTTLAALDVSSRTRLWACHQLVSKRISRQEKTLLLAYSQQPYDLLFYNAVSKTLDMRKEIENLPAVLTSKPVNTRDRAFGHG